MVAKNIGWCHYLNICGRKKKTLKKCNCIVWILKRSNVNRADKQATSHPAGELLSSGTFPTPDLRPDGCDTKRLCVRTIVLNTDKVLVAKEEALRRNKISALLLCIKSICGNVCSKTTESSSSLLAGRTICTRVVLCG